MKFSIVVPVYNVEKYISKCIDSLVNQGYQDYEVLLIDDGSTDSSADICKTYVDKYDYVKYFKKENGGLSDARNYGVAKSQGDYLIFVDSDDYIAPDVLGVFAEYLSDSVDVMITRLVEAFPDKSIPRDDGLKKVNRNPSKMEAVDWVMSKSYNTWPAQKYVVSKAFVKKNNLSFKKGFLHEDVDWTSRIFLLAESFRVCDLKWYFHRMERDGSIMNRINSKRITDVIRIASDYLTYTSTIKEINANIKECIVRRVLISVYTSINLCKRISREDRNHVAHVIEQHENVFLRAPGPKYSLFLMCIKIMGPRMAIELLAKV